MSALQVLHRHCAQARSQYHYEGGLSHDWLGYYERNLTADQSRLNEWNIMAALLSKRPPSPEAITSKEETQLLIRSKLKEIMMSVDIDEVTSKVIRQKLEKDLAMDLFKYKSYIDQEMLTILGQMDAATEIFPHVYLGSEWNASNLEELQKNGIGYILNVTMEIDNFFPGMFKYKNIRVYDNEKTDLLFHWDETYRYINAIKERGSKVLVHCKMGISRSASVVIAYAMKAFNLTLGRATELVRSKRSCVKPNNAFACQLKTYEGILDASRQRHNALWRSKSETNLQQPHQSSPKDGASPTSPNRPKDRMQKRATGRRSQPIRPCPSRGGTHGNSLSSSACESTLRNSYAFTGIDHNLLLPNNPTCLDHCLAKVPNMDDVFVPIDVDGSRNSASGNSNDDGRIQTKSAFCFDGLGVCDKTNEPACSVTPNSGSLFHKSSSSLPCTSKPASGTGSNLGSPQLDGMMTLYDRGERIMDEHASDVSLGLHHSQSSSSHLYCYADSSTESASRSSTQSARFSSPTEKYPGEGRLDALDKLSPRREEPLDRLRDELQPAASGLLISSLTGRRPKSWSPDDRISSSLFPSPLGADEGASAGSGDDLSVGGLGRRRSGSLDFRTPFELQRSKLCAGAVDSLTSPSLVRSASTGGSVEGLSPLYLAQGGSVRGMLPQHLQLSSSVKARITEFETASGRALASDPVSATSGGAQSRNPASATELESKVSLASHATRRTPLLTFDNTVTSSDDFEADDVIEIPLSATDEVIPYDPLTVRIRSEQQQMMERHAQQKKLAYKNTRSPTLSNMPVQHPGNCESSIVVVRPEMMPKPENSSLHDEGNPCVMVPNESVTWKTGIVKRQKEDFEELTKSSDSVRGYYGSCEYRESPAEASNYMLASTSLGVLNSISVGGTEDESCTDDLIETCPIVRSKSLKESRGRSRVSDPFSNDLDRVFAKEEKKSKRCSTVVNDEAGRNSPSRNNSWGSYDSALGLENRERDLPSRQSSWGSCDTRVTGLYPSRNNSISKFDTTRRPHPEGKNCNVLPTKQYSSHSPITIVSCADESEKSTRSVAQTGLSRIGSFSGSSSQRLEAGIVSSYSSDHLNSPASYCRSAVSVESAQSPLRNRIDVNSGREGFVESSDRIGKNLATLSSKVHLPPSFKILRSDREPADKPCDELAHIETTIPVPSPRSSVPAQKMPELFRNRFDFQVIPTDCSCPQLPPDMRLLPMDQKSNIHASVTEPFISERLTDDCAATTRDLHSVRSPTSPSSDSCFNALATHHRSVNDSRGYSSSHTSPIDDVLVPGTVRQQRRRLESWLHDSSENKDLERGQHMDGTCDYSASKYVRSWSSCSVEAGVSPVSPSSQGGKISRSLSEKRATFDGRRYGGRVRKLTRNLEEISNSVSQSFTLRRGSKTAVRQRSHSLERLSTSPTSPHKDSPSSCERLPPSPPQKNSPNSPLRDSTPGAQSELSRLVIEAEAQVRDLERDVSESSQESTDEISVKSLVDIYEKPLADKVVGKRIKLYKDSDTSNNINNNFYVNNNLGGEKTRPRCDSAGEKYLPPVPQRKSSLEITVRSSSQPPRIPLKTKVADVQLGLASKAKNHFLGFRRTASSAAVRSPSSHFLQGSSNKHGSGPQSPKLPPGCPKPLQSFGSSSFRRPDNKNLETSTAGTIGNANIPDNRTRSTIAPGRRGYSLSTSKSSPVLCKSSLSEQSSTSLTSGNLEDASSNKIEVSSSPNGRAQACSTEMRRRKQQGKTHPLSRLPTRETGLP